ncbi:MAG: phosphoadenylyl-sulfate reductase [Akkermansiaceae bacterium]|nr:phosphoadenylyl-sulfate reductase [Armatimonadota bacterium]
MSTFDAITGPVQAALWSEQLATASPQEILRWAAGQFGDKLGVACSFGGVSGMAILDMAVKIQPDVRVFYVDTEFLFPETYATRDAAAAKYNIIPLGYRPKLTPEEQAAKHGAELWRTAPDQCCAIRKVEPNERALEGLSAWVAGLRRDQGDTRRDVPPVQWDKKFGLFKIAPLFDWTEKDVWRYIAANDVPTNPLHDVGYASIGCTHCTVAGQGRDGRWQGSAKTECGLHR